jgi:hypothetical protein
MTEESPDFSDDEVTNILREALKVKLDEKRRLPKKVEINRALISTISEFLKCFKLIGYDLDGNPVVLTIYKEKIEKSALDNAFLEQIGKFMESKIN